MGSTKEKYMNPITFEAELFAHNLENLSRTYKHIDAVMVSSLEKVMNAIEHFLESNTSEIVSTERIELVECEDVSDIKRIYHCARCKTDLGKSAEKVTLHLIETCTGLRYSEGAEAQHRNSSRHENETNAVKDRGNKKAQRAAMHKEQRKKIKQNTEDKLNKKARSLLTMDFNAFFEDHVKIATKLKCLPDYDEIERDLLDTISTVFPKEKIKIYKFGSRLAGIGTRESDLDLYIDVGDTFDVFHNRANKEVLLKLKNVARALQQHKKWTGLVKIDKARVPIVKVLHARTGIECDINFSNSLGTINTEYLGYIFNIQPIARLLCIFLKKWLTRTKLSSEISTYSFMLMALVYLETLEVIPSMERLQKNVNEEKSLTVGPWLYMFATLSLNELDIPLEVLDQSNMLKFIRGFFIFYTNFKFDDNIICPYLGKVIKKIDVEKVMPSRYIEYVKSSDNCSLELDRPIIVQDPIQLNHNTTKSLSAAVLKTIKTLMVKSLEVLNEVFLF